MSCRRPTASSKTVGRRTRRPHQNPVGNGLAHDHRTFWIVAEHGHQASYVRNIAANPHVRVRVGRTWHTGRAEICPDDDPDTRLRAIGRPINAFMVRAMGTQLLTVKITLDQHQPTSSGERT